MELILKNNSTGKIKARGWGQNLHQFMPRLLWVFLEVVLYNKTREKIVLKCIRIRKIELSGHL